MRSAAAEDVRRGLAALRAGEAEGRRVMRATGLRGWGAGASPTAPRVPNRIGGDGSFGEGVTEATCISGIAWEDPIRVVQGEPDILRGGLPFQNGRSVAVTADGDVYVAVSGGASVDVYLLDGSAFIRVVSVAGEEVGRRPSKISAVARGSDIAVVWSTHPASDPTDGREAQIRSVHFASGHIPFLGDLQLEPVSDHPDVTNAGRKTFGNDAPSAAFDETGNLWVGWNGHFPNTADDAFVARRNERGAWHRTGVSTLDELGADKAPSAGWVSVVASGAEVYAVYNYFSELDGVNCRDVYAAGIVDLGVGLEPDTEAWVAGGHQGSGGRRVTAAMGPAYDPSAAGGPDRIYVAWHQPPTMSGGHPVLPRSSDSADGTTWDPPVDIVSFERFDREKFTCIAAHPVRAGWIAAAWESRQRVTETPPHDIRTAISCSGRWAEVPNPVSRPLNPTNGYPSLVFVEGRDVHLTWFEESPTQGVIWYARGRVS